MRPIDYKNIIFDLGGVILNIDYQRTISAFQNLGIKDFEAKYSQLQQADLFDEYERGEISSETFRNRIRNVFNSPISDSEIDEAWNAMLMDLPKERLELLKGLTTSKQTTLLSNTNEIHILAFNEIILQQYGLNDLSGYFLKPHYSFEVGMRKPETRIFEYVLMVHGFKAEETLFIDDSIQHIEGARKAGINAYHLRIDKGETILDLF
jgi:putative hydrolase of the HAD superfamily